MYHLYCIVVVPMSHEYVHESVFEEDKDESFYILDPMMISEISKNKEKISPEKVDQIIAALALLEWYGDTASANEIANTFKDSQSAAFVRSTYALRNIKREHARDANEFNIRIKMFLRLGIEGKNREECQKIWQPFVHAACVHLGIPQEEEYRAFFSGLGSYPMGLCIIAYEMDWNKAFVLHEYFHASLRGYDTEHFFDECMTEFHAYAECDCFDMETHVLASKEEIEAKGIDILYYDHLLVFLLVDKEIPGFFDMILTGYRFLGSKMLQEEVPPFIGEKLYEVLLRTDPDEYNPALGDNQIWLSPARSYTLVQQILKERRSRAIVTK